MEERYEEELKLIGIMIKLNKKVGALCEFLGGDVELFDDVMDDMDELLADLLIRKGTYLDIDLCTDLVNEEMALEEVLECSKQYEKELIFGNH